MNDYISREAAIDRLNENWRRTNTGSIAEACYSAAIDSIHSIPAADVVERPRWIPVTERLPDGEAWDRVLVYTDEGNIQTAPKCKVGNGWITHWIPLPEPPKEEAR